MTFTSSWLGAHVSMLLTMVARLATVYCIECGQQCRLANVAPGSKTDGKSVLSCTMYAAVWMG